MEIVKNFHFFFPYADLDADEVGLTFMCDGLGKKSFAAARRTIEENTARRLHAKFEEHLRMFDWVLEMGNIS